MRASIDIDEVAFLAACHRIRTFSQPSKGMLDMYWLRYIRPT